MKNMKKLYNFLLFFLCIPFTFLISADTEITPYKFNDKIERYDIPSSAIFHIKDSSRPTDITYYFSNTKNFASFFSVQFNNTFFFSPSPSIILLISFFFVPSLSSM